MQIPQEFKVSSTPFECQVSFGLSALPVSLNECASQSAPGPAVAVRAALRDNKRHELVILDRCPEHNHGDIDFALNKSVAPFCSPNSYGFDKS